MNTEAKYNELLDVAYKYYPCKIDSINQKEEYLLTLEYKKILNQINLFSEPYPKEINFFLNDLRNINQNNFLFNDLTYFNWMDRCYTFEFKKKVNNSFFIIKLLRSIIRPFFIIETELCVMKNNSFKHFKLKKKDPVFIDLINKIIPLCNKHNLLEFDYDLVNIKIENINFDDIKMGEFTFFNAFFNSQQIII